MARTRVSPGSAAARLARWRWHRNPPLSRALVKRLMEWRSPDYPAIKALAQSRHPATEADSAIRDLMAQYERPDLKASDLQHLKKTLAMVEAETGVANRSNPPSVYNSLQRALKARGFNTFNRRDNADDDTTDPEINLGHGLSLALDNSGWPCGVVKITTKPEWTMVDRYWQDDPSATEIASRVAAFAAKHGVKSNPRGGRRLAQARGRIIGKNQKAYRRAFRVVRKRTGLESMPALPWGYSPAHRVWGKALKLKQRAVGAGAVRGHLRGRGYSRMLKQVKRNPLGRCSTCGRPHVDPMTLNSWPVDKSKCYQAETGGDPRCRARKGKKRRNPSRHLARSRCRIVGRATLRARINKASGGARNAVMRSILAQVMAGKVKIRGARISAAVKRGIRRGR